jgi:hypothetical protein
MGPDKTIPRELTALERALLLWVLPADRSGYAEYRKLVQEWMVVGRDRRGEQGGYVLAAPGLIPDVESPLPPLFAFGLVKTGTDEITVSVRERLGDQLEFEIVTPTGVELAGGLESYHRWTLSEWLPSLPCPGCRGALREVAMKTETGHELVLAVCAKDHRLWVYDAQSGVNHPIPVTGFYNELVLQQKVRDRRRLPDSKRLFTDLGTCSDAALTGAFSSYNRLRTRVFLGEPLVVPTEGSLNWFRRATRRLFKSEKQGGSG